MSSTIVNGSDLASTLPRPRWPLWAMIALTVVYVILGGFSVPFALLGFMCFDAGVTRQAVAMFTMGWLLPIGFFTGTCLAWVGYFKSSRRLTLAGAAIPVVVVFIFCCFVAIALLVS